jgi:hypothetical protein
MAALSNADRLAVGQQFCSDISAQRQPLAVNRTDFRAALAAIDDWVDANAASFNAAIPQPARTNLTVRQKAQLLEYVVRRRFEVS